MMFVEKHPLLFYTMVVVSLLIAMLVAIAPFAPEYQVLRPELVCLLVIYWVVSVPQHLGISFAFLTGLVQDLVEQSIWGAHALALSIVAYICVSSYQRIKSYSIWHQTAWVSVLVGLHQLVVNWMQSLAGYRSSTISLLASVIISTLLWPVLLSGLRRLRQNYRMI